MYSRTFMYVVAYASDPHWSRILTIYVADYLYEFGYCAIVWFQRGFNAIRFIGCAGISGDRGLILRKGKSVEKTVFGRLSRLSDAIERLRPLSNDTMKRYEML